MKKRWVLLNTMIVVIIFMAISLIFEEKQEPISRNSQPPSTTVSDSGSLIRSTLEKPLPGYDMENYVPLTEKADLSCREFLDHIRGSLFSQLLEEVLNNPDKIPKNCPGPDSPMAGVIHDKLASCLPLTKTDSSESGTASSASNRSRRDDCGLALMLMKSNLLLEGVRRDDLNSMTFAQLIARVMEILSSPPVDMEKFGQVLHELDSRENNQASLKKGLAVYYGNKYETSEGPAREEAFENLKHYLNSATQLNPEDWETYELRLFYMLQESPDQARMLADRLRVQYPQMGLGPYYLAYIEWKNQNRDQAAHYAREAQQREPHVSRYSATAEKIRSAKFDDKIFTVQINITPDL